jgi:hypothetical protein
MYEPMPVVDHERISEAISTALKQLSPDVLDISYRIQRDWTDEWVIYLTVLLSDSSATDANLRSVTRKARETVSDLVFSSGIELFPHIHFRSESEDAKRTDPVFA